MQLSPALRAELVELAARRRNRARILIAGASMEPLLRAGMVVDVEPLDTPPSLGDVLVFRTPAGLIAHRLVGGDFLAFRAHNGIVAQKLRNARTLAYETCGDAYPDRAEIVPEQLVVGRVVAVWSNAQPDARRIDDARFRRLGTFLARTRALRSFLVRVRAYGAMIVADPASVAEPGAFSALVAATREFEGGQYVAALASLLCVPQKNLVDMARRHHASGLLARWLDDASAAGVTVPGSLHDAFRRIRWTNALQAGRVLACVRDVRDRFVAAGVPHIFLKGGARLAADALDADLQFAGDLDVIVPAARADHALALLRAAGYRDVIPPNARARFAALHHREPLCPPDIDIPVEIHVCLVPPALVSQHFDYAALAPASHRITGPAGEVDVLDDLAAAVHLAYHARDQRVWRDVVLLARLLGGFDAATRARFNTFIAAEKRDGLRLASAVAAADALVDDKTSPSAAVKRYLAWAEARENLPRRFAHTDIIEAMLGRCPAPKLAFANASREPLTWLRCWIRNVVLLPAIVRFVRAGKLNESSIL